MKESELLANILRTPEGATFSLNNVPYAILSNFVGQYHFLSIERRNTIDCPEHGRPAVFVEPKEDNYRYRCPSGHPVDASFVESHYIHIDNDAILSYFLTQNKIEEVGWDGIEKKRFENSLPGCKIVGSIDLPLLIYVKRDKFKINDAQVMHSLNVSEHGKIGGIICLTNVAPNQEPLERFLKTHTFGTTDIFDISQILHDPSDFTNYLNKLNYLHRTFSTTMKIINALDLETQKAEEYLEFTKYPTRVLAELNKTGQEGSETKYEKISDYILGTITKTSRKKLGQSASGLPLPDVLAYFEASTQSKENHMNVLALDTKSGLDSNFQRKLESTATSKVFDYIHTVTKAVKDEKRDMTVFGGFLLPMISFSHLKNRIIGIGKAREQAGISNKILIFTNAGMAYLFSIGHFRSELNQYDWDLKELKKQIFQPLSFQELDELPNECQEFDNKDWEDYKKLYLTSKDNGIIIISPTVFHYYFNKIKGQGKTDIFDRMESLIIDYAKKKAPKEKLSKTKI